MHNLLIDTDPGMGTLGADPEDALAIVFAARSHEMALSGITCVQGNVPLSHSVANAHQVLALLGRAEVPVAAGHAEPLSASKRREQVRWLTESGSRQRLFPAADPSQLDGSSTALISSAARKSEDGLVIAAIGPLTNLAKALSSDAELPKLIKRLVIMGGAFEVPGNITPVAEFNFWMDPEAAQTVLDAGLRPILIGLDVCNRTRLTSDDLADISWSPLGTFVREACDPWLRRLSAAGEVGFHLFDSLSVAAALIPELITTAPAYVEVDIGTGPAQGSAIAWLPNRPSSWTRPKVDANAEVAVDLDLERFQAIFKERVGGAL